MKKNHSIIPRTFEEVASQIANYITLEKQESDSKFPTERNLSEQLNVSRSSIREGLRVLEILGFLYSKQGGGTFVSKPTPFIIPYDIIKREQLDSQILNKYYQVAISTAETIVFHSFAVVDTYKFTYPSHHEPEKDFFYNFAKTIEILGKEIENEYYVQLWKNIISLLQQNDFLDQKSFSSLEFDNFYQALITKDRTRMRDFFSNLHSVR